MDAKIQTSKSASDLKSKITEHIRELAKETDIARVSAEMQRYLDMCSKFHQYSPFNVWLILMEKPTASVVAGFHKWITMKRYVRKGEHGIAILAPVFVPDENENGEQVEKLVGFKTVYVFDISQTDGEPLPEPPNWKSPEQNALLTERLLDFTASKGIIVKVKYLPGETQGISLGGTIILSPQAGTKTLIHEIAHELLHHKQSEVTSQTIRELEAEAVAYVVGKHFGMDGLSSPNYVALYDVTADMIMQHMERIRSTAAEVIKAIEGTMMPN
jgi:antirestriction protein ArdC